jgi:hypothetical protein
MSISFACSNCGAALKAHDDSRGMRLPCPRCKQETQVPKMIGACPICDTPMEDEGRRWHYAIFCLLFLGVPGAQLLYMGVSDRIALVLGACVVTAGVLTAVFCLRVRVLRCPKCWTVILSRNPLTWTGELGTERCLHCRDLWIPARDGIRPVVFLGCIPVVLFLIPAQLMLPYPGSVLELLFLIPLGSMARSWYAQALLGLIWFGVMVFQVGALPYRLQGPAVRCRACGIRVVQGKRSKALMRDRVLGGTAMVILVCGAALTAWGICLWVPLPRIRAAQVPLARGELSAVAIAGAVGVLAAILLRHRVWCRTHGSDATPERTYGGWLLYVVILALVLGVATFLAKDAAFMGVLGFVGLLAGIPIGIGVLVASRRFVLRDHLVVVIVTVALLLPTCYHLLMRRDFIRSKLGDAFIAVVAERYSGVATRAAFQEAISKPKALSPPFPKPPP